MTFAIYSGLVAILAITLVALGRKWQLKPKHYLPWTVAMAAVSCGVLAAILHLQPDSPWWLALSVALGVSYVVTIVGILYCFFRDPERSPPRDDSQIVSPADGTIVYVKKIENGRFPFAVKNNNTIPLSDFVDAGFVPNEGVQIGIAMNFLNVHVNRSPISGIVKMVRRIPGEFKSLKHIASLLENERVLMVVQNRDLEIGMVQIASRLVRRIVPYVAVGQPIPQGCRVGVIRFGSQVDVLIPATPGIEVAVQAGDNVTAGESVIATHKIPNLSSVSIRSAEADHAVAAQVG